MKKITKCIITITVYILIILYFLVSCSRNEYQPTTSKICKNFDIMLSNRIEKHFITSLPETNGEVSKVTVEELISEGLITLEDLEDVGTSCSGEAYVSKVGERYYYYNNISCGICSINNMYTDWSDWTETLPNFGNKRYQVMTKILYNYSSSEEKWTEWSDWGESIDQIKAPTLPVGVEVVNTEIQEKNQYRYREATYKWYKLSSNVEYYNGGAYSETAPSGYEKLASSKKYKRTTKAYETKTELTQKENVKDGDTIVTVSGYRIKEPKYIYSYTTPSTTRITDTCETSVTKYICYKTTDTTYEVPDVSTTQSTALSTCKSQQPSWASTCTTYQTSSSGYAYGSTQTATTTIINDGSCYIRVSTDICFDSTTNNLLKGMSCKTNSPSCSSASDVGNYKITGCEIKWVRCKMNLFISSEPEVPDYCPSPSVMGNDGQCTYNLSASSCTRGGTKIRAGYSLTYQTCEATTIVKYGYKYTVTTRTDTGNTYYETCPSGYPNKDTSKTKTECTKYRTEIIPGVTKYLTISGREVTSIDEADYLSESKYNELKSSNSSLSSYTKTNRVMYDYETTSYQEGTCPSGKVCDTKTLYKANIYEYKWFKSGTATKIDCKNGAYSASAPETGCIKDESSVKWGSWSEFSDKEVKKTDNNEVETKKLIRYRKSYISSEDLAIKEWYDYQDFEEKTGKKIEDLRKDKNVNLQEKIVYKYRILK